MRLLAETSLEVGSAAATAQLWLETLNQDASDVELDISALERIDSAGVQLLFSLAREVNSRHGSLHISGSSRELDRVLSCLGLSLQSLGATS